MDDSYPIVMPPSMTESCQRCFGQVLGSSTVELLSVMINGIPDEHMAGLQVYGAKPQWDLYFPYGPVKYHTLFMWHCRACNHEYLTYDFTCGGRETSSHILAPRSYTPVPADDLDGQRYTEHQRLRAGTYTATGPAADVTAMAGQGTPAVQLDHHHHHHDPEPSHNPMSRQQGLASRTGGRTAFAIEREGPGGRSVQTTPWTHISASTRADGNSGAPAIPADQPGAAPSALPKQKVRNRNDLRKMRKMMACNVCRESNKKCDESHPGPRIPHKEWMAWKQMKEDEHLTNEPNVTL